MRALVILWIAAVACGVRAGLPSGDPVAEAAAAAVLAAMSGQGLTGVVQPRVLGRADSMAGNLRAEPRPVGPDQLRRRMVVWVDLWAAGRFVRSAAVALDVELSPEDAVAGLPKPGPESPGLARKPELAADVLRGEWAALRTAAGAVSLESRVEVLQDGRTGDRVRVRQQGATGIVLARVVGRGQLELAP